MAETPIPVSVSILDRPYKLHIAPSKEAALRRAAERVNKQAEAYAQRFDFRDKQDLLAMVCLGQITELIKTQEGLTYKDKELMVKLKEIDTTLEKHLHPAQNSL